MQRAWGPIVLGLTGAMISEGGPMATDEAPYYFMWPQLGNGVLIVGSSHFDKVQLAAGGLTYILRKFGTATPH